MFRWRSRFSRMRRICGRRLLAPFGKGGPETGKTICNRRRKRERDRLVQCAYSISTNIIVNGGEEQCVVVEDSLIESTDNHWLVSHACLINA